MSVQQTVHEHRPREIRMTAQQRIDAILRSIDPDSSMAFVAVPLERGVMVQHDAKTVHVSEAWVDAVDDELLRHAILHECTHRSAFQRLRHEMAGDAVVDLIFDEARWITSAGNGVDRIEEPSDVDPTRFRHIVATGEYLAPAGTEAGRFLHFSIRKDDVEAIMSFDNDVFDGRTAEERIRDVVDRMTAAGYQISVMMPVGMDLSGSMEGHFDPQDIAPLFEDRRMGIGRRLSAAIVRLEDDMPHKRLAARALLAAGTPMAETFDRQDENDRWNRSQGRRGGGRRKGR